MPFFFILLLFFLDNPLFFGCFFFFYGSLNTHTKKNYHVYYFPTPYALLHTMSLQFA